MKIFVATSYSSRINYETGEVLPEYRAWLEGILINIESMGQEVFCALREDWYKINNEDPAGPFSLDFKQIKESDVLLALLSDKASVGVQTEIGVAVALHKLVILAHEAESKLSYFNQAMVQAKVAVELLLPFSAEKLAKALAGQAES